MRSGRQNLKKAWRTTLRVLSEAKLFLHSASQKADTDEDFPKVFELWRIWSILRGTNPWRYRCLMRVSIGGSVSFVDPQIAYEAIKDRLEMAAQSPGLLDPKYIEAKRLNDKSGGHIDFELKKYNLDAFVFPTGRHHAWCKAGYPLVSGNLKRHNHVK